VLYYKQKLRCTGVGKLMKIYIDTCGWNRPHDRPADEKIVKEATAIRNIIKQAQEKKYVVLSSITLKNEIGKTKNAIKHRRMMNLYQNVVTDPATYKKDIFESLSKLAGAAGVKKKDILHLCFAEASDADYLITTDGEFIEAAAKLNINVKVINPLNFPLGGIT
jgi:predicted nucleic acid-binding protein